MIKRVIWLLCLFALFTPALGLAKTKPPKKKSPIISQTKEAAPPPQSDNTQGELKKLTFDTQLNYLYKVSNNQTKAQTTEHIVVWINQQQPNYALRYSQEEIAKKELGNPVWLTLYDEQGLPRTDLTGTFEENNVFEINAWGGDIVDVNDPRLHQKTDISQNFPVLTLTKTGQKQQIETYSTEEYTGQVQLSEQMQQEGQYPQISFTVYFSDQIIYQPNWVSVFTRGDIYTPTINQLPVKIIWKEKQHSGIITTHQLTLQNINKSKQSITYKKP